MFHGLTLKTLRRCSQACGLAVLLLVSPGLTQAQLPTLGDGSDMTTAAERKLGERIARELYRDPDFIDDAMLVDYVQGVWQPLLAAAKLRGELSSELDERFAWEILMGKDRTINAFALPGGYLGLHLGLLGVVTNRDELASVLAHELSHVTQRHISRLMSQQSRMAPLAIGAMILGALAASKSPEAANAMIIGGQAAAAQSQLNFSRDMEREADRIGYGVMTQAGYDPLGFVTMFDKLQKASRLNDNGSFPYLRSHPLTTERIADMQARQTLLTRPPAAQADVVHAMMAARARVLSDPGSDQLRAWVGEARGAPVTGPGDTRVAAQLYAGALASSRLRDFEVARDMVQRLKTVVAPYAAAFRVAGLLAADVEWAAGDVARTAAALAALDPKAAGRPELLLSAQVAIRSGQAADAAQRLQTRVALDPRDATAWQLLASAYAAQGLTLRSIRAEAEQQVARLDYSGALDRFKAAQNFVRTQRPGGPPIDHIEASIIDTRTRLIESLVREQALER